VDKGEECKENEDVGVGGKGKKKARRQGSRTSYTVVRAAGYNMNPSMW